jgi:hypothetical protein
LPIKRKAITIQIIVGNALEGLLQLIDEVRPADDRRATRTGGFSGFIGGTAHHLALHEKCNILGVR